MKIAADTNVLLRLILADDDALSRVAAKVLEDAELVAISVHTLCEMNWVLALRYEMTRADIVAAIRSLMETRNVVVNRPAVEAGLAILEAGGDFADGAIAFDGQWLGGETFVSFDKKAVKLLKQAGTATMLLR
ncbi:type II toxin-antitoxin system VapC family toxin [Novosphingobium sp.]|uniref:type II toxin-antitoxin system VapC family toxin n=1 Tax=Novosphingobium sp. TaxID=1874826 RepID=UPI00286A1048|nr:type II toxin-antitoxin system VapC family toxin [Novosphingobium sp.]